MHQSFDRISCFCTRKLFFFCFLPADHRNCKHFFTELRVYVQHLFCPLLRFLRCCMRRMPFLPQKFTRTQKRPGFLLPSDNRTPLIIYFWKIAVRLDVIFIKITKQRLRSRSDTKSFQQLALPAMRHPRHLRRKAFHMIFFFIQKTFRNKQRHIHVLYSGFFKTTVQFVLDIFPQRVSCRLDNHTAFHRRIIDQFCFFYYIGIPLREILLHTCNGFH